MAEGGSAYREVILKTLREKEWREGKGFGVWIVQTIKDDKSFKIQVRAGMYRPDKVSGEKVLPKDGLDVSYAHRHLLLPCLALVTERRRVPLHESHHHRLPPRVEVFGVLRGVERALRFGVPQQRDAEQRQPLGIVIEVSRHEGR